MSEHIDYVKQAHEAFENPRGLSSETILDMYAKPAIADLEAERDKWEWVARDACRELAYETHVNPESPLDYRLAHYQGETT